MTRNIFVQDTLVVPEWELLPLKKMSLIFTFISFSFTDSNVNWGKSLGKDSLSHHPHSFKPEVLRGCLIWSLTLLIMNLRPRKLKIPTRMVAELPLEPVWGSAPGGSFRPTAVHGWGFLRFWSPESNMMPIVVFLPPLLVSFISFQEEGRSEMCKTRMMPTVMPALLHSSCKNLNMLP